MNILLVPFFTGLLLVAFLFALSFFIVVFLKWAYLKMLDLFPKKKTISKPPEKKAPRKINRKPVRSIEINPDEIDRIYVKKIS